MKLSGQLVAALLAIRVCCAHLFNDAAVSAKHDVNLYVQLSQNWVGFQAIKLFSNHNVSRSFVALIHTQHLRVVVLCKNLCPETLRSLSKYIFSKQISWLFVHYNQDALESFMKLENFKHLFRPDGEVFVALIEQNAQQVFRITFSSEECQLLSVAKYTQQRWKWQRDKVDPLPLRRYFLKLGTIHMPPHVMIKKDSAGVKTYFGFKVAVVNLLSQYLGFRYELIHETQNSFGGVTKNGSWTGLMGMINRKEIDMTAMGMILNVQRLQIGDYMPPIGYLDVVGLYQKPLDDSQTFNPLAYFTPFPWSVWLSIFGLCAITLIGMIFATASNDVHISSNSFSNLNNSISYNFWTILSATLRMDLIDFPRLASLHVMIFSLIIFILMISSAYNSFLTSVLAVKKEKVLFENFDDVLDEGSYYFTVQEQNSIGMALKTAKSGVLQKMWKKMQSNPSSFVLSFDEAVQQIQNKKCIYLEGRPLVQPVAATSCMFTIIPQGYNKAPLNMALDKNSPYSELISRKLLSIMTSGVLKRETDKYYLKPDSYQCTHALQELQSVGFQQAAGCFICYILGVLLAILCFSIEIVVANVKS